MITLKKINKNGRVHYYWKKFKLFSRESKSFKGFDYELNLIKKKLCMEDNIWQNNDTLFYVPYYPVDVIQTIIVETQNYYEIDLLEELKNYIPNNPTIIDIGANIGNHSLYFAKELNAKKIISFEPILNTYKILQKNIEINNLSDIIEAYNIGLSNINGTAKIKTFALQNIGATCIEQSQNGNLLIKRLDDLEFSQLNQVDFMKIDVEGHEINMLEGAQETIKKFKPIIFIEISDNNKNQVITILSKLNYTLKKEFKNSNYLFIPNN